MTYMPSPIRLVTVALLALCATQTARAAVAFRGPRRAALYPCLRSTPRIAAKSRARHGHAG